MKVILLVALLLVTPLISASLLETQFQQFMSKYGKNYSGLEYERRLKIFEQNMRIAAENQRNDASAEHGVTKFFDMTFEEFKAVMLSEEVPSEAIAPNCLKNGIYHPKINMFQIPDSLDYRTQPGVVTSVKDQASCGSCWAFSTAANIEGVYGKAGKPLDDSLSPQQIVDCSKGCSSEMYNGKNITVCNEGCNGGWPWSAMWDIEKWNGLVGWNDYTYTGRSGTCQDKPSPKTLAKISNYTCITHEDGLDEDELARALVTYGPLSIAMNANNFFSYKSGIFDVSNCATYYVNHAILLVGYGTEDGKDYWIVKNSWGPSWGENGYIRVARGKNMCGITEGVVTATL